MFKQVKAIMLPSKEMTRKGDLTFFGNKLVIASSVLHLAQVSQNLYFLSDEEIEDGEYGFCMNLYNQGLQPHQIIFKMDADQRHAMIELGGQKNANVFKIIATTDKSLIEESRLMRECYPLRIHLIPQSFIEHFVSEYNKGNIITEVEVEYEPDRPKNSTHYVMGSFNWQLKINSDNTVNIKPIKDSWSREEVESILHMIVNDSHCSINRVKHANSNECAGFVNKWIEQNL